MASRVLGENLPAVGGQGDGWVANDQRGSRMDRAERWAKMRSNLP